MARRKKRPLSKDAKRRRRQGREQAQRRDDVVHDTAARFTCAAEAADDFAYQCQHALEELDINLLFNRLALEIWNQRPAGAEALVTALEELLAERLRHRDTLQRIEQRLQGLADDPSFHIHLEPVEAYRELVRSRVFPQSPAT